MLVSQAGEVRQTLTDLLTQHGVLAVFLVMAIDAILPVGGELTMLLAGALAGGALTGSVLLFGHDIGTGLGAYLVLATAGTLGYLAGSLVGWQIGRSGGRPLLERHGRWLHLGPKRMVAAERWFDRHGANAVLLGRLTPLVRSFISIPAGVFGSPIGTYTALTAIGSALWCFGFAGAGWALGDNFDVVHRAFRYADVAAVAAVAGVAIWLVARGRRRAA
jgi:membrane protein DedA with SNARE-associated domain